MEILLDGRLMVSREALHDLLEEKFSFPDYYGRNLDALYDLLSEYPQRIEIVIVHADVMLENLQGYGNALLKTLVDVSRECVNLELTIRNEII